MPWLLRKMKKRKAKKQYHKCLDMIQKHAYVYNYTGSMTERQLMDYWRGKAEEAWIEYDRI